MCARFHLYLVASAVLVTVSARAQQVAVDAGPAPTAWKFHATLDSVYVVNFSHPADGIDQLRNFDSQSDALTLSGATAGAQYLGDHFGFHVDAGYGEMSNRWGGAAFALKVKPLKSLSFNPRWEYFADLTGFTTGVPQRLREWTATVDYHPRSLITWRLEYRADHSNQLFFEAGSRPAARKDQQTALVAMILTLRRDR